MVFIQSCDRRATMSPSFNLSVIKKKINVFQPYVYDSLKQGRAQTRASKLGVTSG